MSSILTSGKIIAHRRLGLVPVALALCCLFGFADSGQAQTPALAPLQAPAVYNNAANANSAIPDDVVMGDFNGDGYLDFAVVEFPSGTNLTGQLEIFFGNKDGSFTSQGFIPIGIISGQPYSTNHNIAVGHFNGPTQGLDIAVAVTQAPGCATGGVVLLYGDGKGNFQSPVCLANPTPVISVAVADFNLDTYDDIAVSNASGSVAGSITVYWNNASVSSVNNQSGFSTTISARATVGTTTQVLYGKIVIGNITGQYAPSIAILANTGPFTQAASFFVTLYLQQNGKFFVNFVPPNSALIPSGNGFSDIAIANVTSSGINSIVGIGATTGITYAPLTGAPFPVLIGAQSYLASGNNGLAFAMADFDGNGTPDFAYLDTSQNLNISLNPGNTTATKIGPFGPVGQGVAAGLSTGLNKWVVVDSGLYQQTTPSFLAYPAARSIAVYLVDPTTGQPSIAPLYTQSSVYTSGTQRAFAVGDFDGDGSPDVAVLGEDASNFNATVTVFHNDYKTTTPGYNTSPTLVDLGTLLGLGGGSIGYGGSTGYALAAGSFRTIDPDIAIVTAQGITLLQNQTAGPGQPFNFVLDANCAGYTGAATNNCYLANDSHFPGIATSNSPRPPILAVDLNGDGYQDIVVAFPQNCFATTQSAIYVLLSNGDGTFKAPIYIPSPVVNPIGLAAGKLLGSTVPDLIVINGGETCSGTQAATGAPTLVGVALIPNNGGGLFGTPQTIYAQTSDVGAPSVSSVAVADMNADGAPDVVISSKDGIHVLLNSPTTLGTFTDKGAVPLYAPIDIIVNTSQIDIADLNQDGKLDVAAAVDGIVYVFAGDGAGNLSLPAQGFASGPNSNQLKINDVNGDGAPDILINNTQGFSVVLSQPFPLAQFELSPSLSYGGINIDSSATQQVILYNTGGGTLQVSNIVFANNTGGQYTYVFPTNPLTNAPACVNGAVMNSNTSLSIRAGGSCTINIVFTPTTVGPANAQLLFYDNAPISNAPNVSGSGTAQYVQTISLSAAGQLGSPSITSISPNTGLPAGTETITVSGMYFQPGATVTFGTTGATSVTFLSTSSLLVVVPALSVGVYDVKVANPDGLSGTAIGGFTVVPNTPPAVVYIDISESITLVDSSALLDAFDQENISVQDVVFVTPVLSIDVPVISFSTNNMGFGSIAPGQTGTQILTVSNTGQATSGLVIANAVISPTGSPFSIGTIVCSNGATSVVTNLPPGGSCLVAISYAAPASGPAATATITFSDDAALSNLPTTFINPFFTQTISLSGTGTTAIAPGAPPTTITIPTINESIKLSDTVSVVALESINITPANQTIPEGARLGYTAIGMYSDGSTRDLTSLVTWSSSNMAIATMAGNVATAAQVVNLTTTITATYQGVQGSTNLTVYSFLKIVPQFVSIKKVTTLGVSHYVLTISVQNAGDVTAAGVRGIASLSPPLRLTGSTVVTNLAPGATANLTIMFPLSVGPSGSKRNLNVVGVAFGTVPNVTGTNWHLGPLQITLP